MKKTICFFAVFACTLSSIFGQMVNFNRDWKFKTGDDISWSKPEYNDSSWTAIIPNLGYEKQGFEKHDGFSWYRIRFFLPKELKTTAFVKEKLRIVLAKIDDVDATYLNGVKIGQTGAFPKDKGGFKSAATEPRRYELASDNPALRWDGENVVAVRVYDKKDTGGMYEGECSFDMLSAMDYLELRVPDGNWEMSRQDTMFKVIYATNTYTKNLRVSLQATLLLGKQRLGPAQGILLKPNETYAYRVALPKAENATVEFTLTEMKTFKQHFFKDATPDAILPKSQILLNKEH